MTDVSQEYMKTDDDLDIGEFCEFDNHDEHPPPATDDPQGAELTQGANIGASAGPDYLDMAKLKFNGTGAPEKFIELAAGLHVFRDALDSPRCNTPSREATIREGISSLVDGSLTELVAAISLEVNQVAALALEIRTLAPEAFDAWVKRQFTIGRPLAMMSAKRKALDLARERFIEDQLEKGRLVAGTIMTAAQQYENFVGIARLALEHDLNITTIDEQVELDLALNDFITARRISFMAQSLISPLGLRIKDLGESMKLLAQVQKYDKSFQVTIDRMRARNRRKLKTVQLSVEKRVTVAVTARADESDGIRAMSA
jgi:hypothetical protein